MDSADVLKRLDERIAFHQAKIAELECSPFATDDIELQRHQRVKSIQQQLRAMLARDLHLFN